MLVPTITFDIHDFKTSRSESFVVENTLNNQELIFTHRFTRNIRFVKTFEEQFNREEKYPTFMIEIFEAEAAIELENEIDAIDEMVGVFA